MSEGEIIWPEPIRKNLPILNEHEIFLVNLLLGLNQKHLFDDWDDVGISDDLKHSFFEQISNLHSTYPVEGGLVSYISRAKRLLESSRIGGNPFDGWRPEIPTGASVDPLTPEFMKFESTGLNDIGSCCFVLVAGGLGERLGYSGIKVELPTEMVTSTCYLHLYSKQILAIQNRFGSNKCLPLAIMVSDDTKDKTEFLLQQNNYFGLLPEQVTLLKQEKVAALVNNDAKIAALSKYEVDTKPHGHGDVHSLLHSSKLALNWLEQKGMKWITFFQDTNALALYMLPTMIAISEEKKLDLNSLTIPRYAKQAVGAIAKLVHTSSGATMTVNIEYNQLDPLLRSTISPQGDTNDPISKQSPFPGNINQLLFSLDSYVKTLNQTEGVMEEFVNPKYADSLRTTFKKPTRLECMMQDIPKVMPVETSCIGFTLAPSWICYSPVKNNATDAAASVAAGVPAGSALSGECDQYFVVSEILRRLGANVETCSTPSSYLGLTGCLSPRIVFDPSFVFFASEYSTRFPNPSAVHISSRSTLFVSGDVVIRSLRLDGSLRLIVSPGKRLVVDTAISCCVIQNEGDRVDAAPESSKEIISMRGYVFTTIEEKVVRIEYDDESENFIFDGINVIAVAE